MIRGTMQGGREMMMAIRKIADKFPDRVGAAIYAEAQIEMTEAKKRTPVSPTPAPPGVIPGTLRASGRVEEPIREGKNISVTMSFGGAAQAYAVPQHERLDYIHTTGQAKYLESVLNESRPYMIGRIGARLKLDKKE